MASTFRDSTFGNKANNATFFAGNILVRTGGTRPTIKLDIALEKLPSSTSYAGPGGANSLTYGYTVDSLASAKLEYTTNGGGAWSALNSGIPIAANTQYTFEVPVSAGNYVNFRQTSGSTVQLKYATAYYHSHPANS